MSGTESCQNLSCTYNYLICPKICVLGMIRMADWQHSAASRGAEVDTHRVIGGLCNRARERRGPDVTSPSFHPSRLSNMDDNVMFRLTHSSPCRVSSF
jgi:hypothetical protein